MRCLIFIAILLMAWHPAGADDWLTDYESSGYIRTPGYDATIDYCRRLAAASPWVHYTTFGVSPQGRELPLLIVNRSGKFTPGEVRVSDNVVFLIQAGIHSGEIDGKDAGLMLVRDIAITREREHLLDGATLLFIPIFNVDGHERRSRYNRANQNGPEEMGWRVTAQNLNLNRDYLKAESPEMQAWLRLYAAWLPEFFADCHVTDGADYQYAVTYAAEVNGTLDKGMTAWLQERLLVPLNKRMKAEGKPMMHYPWFRNHHDPRSGLKSWVASPRLSEGYCAEQNRPGLLIETHSLKDYRTRVEGTYAILAHTAALLNEEGEVLRTLVANADRNVASPRFRSRPFALQYQMSDTDSVMLEFLGVEYTVETSDLTGGAWFRYSDRPTTIEVPYFYRQQATVTTMLPEAYIVPREWATVIERLKLHGVRVERTAEAVAMEVETYRFNDVSWSDVPYEGRHRSTYEFKPVPATRTFPAGSAVVDMNQRAARIAAHILEPGGPDSFVSWGFFDSIFEQKEYIESYVIETLAREMLASDADLRTKFDAWRAEHPLADAQTIRHWFYQRSPFWDQQLNLYPVGRILDRAVIDRIRR